MIKEVILAKIGLTMETGRIISWLKKEGDYVKQDDPLFEVETDKVTTVVESFHTGYLKKILVEKDQEVPVNTVIAYIGDKEDTVPAGKTFEQETGEEKARPHKEVKLEPEIMERGVGKAIKGRINASPLAKRLARELDIDLSKVKGSGPEGRIGKEDVFAAADKKKARGELLQSAEVREKQVVHEGKLRIFSEEKLTGIRKLVAQRMKESYIEAPHIYLELSVDMSKATQLRERVNKEAQGKRHITYTDIVVKAIAQTLERHRLLNATLKDDSVVIYEDINIGIATATEKGLIVPVVKNVNKLSLAKLSAICKDLIDKIRSGKYGLDDLSDGTFTITNLGMFGIESFRPILNIGQSAILAVGAIKNTPVADESGEVCVKPLLSLSLACDHRIVDGADGAKFLSDLKSKIENCEGIFG
jgi:pyruvate dehydrogenase E2 component (dihydrolipoamide acetyltransferase)